MDENENEDEDFIIEFGKYKGMLFSEVKLLDENAYRYPLYRAQGAKKNEKPIL